MESYEQTYYQYQTEARGLLTENALVQHFDKLAKWYAHRLSKYLPESKTADCLDIPCGYGNFLYFLRLQGYQNAVGYDLDPEQVRLARLVGLQAHEGEATVILSDESKTYDCITSLDFIEHLSRYQALEFLRLCWERLKPGGLLILRTPCADGPFGSHDAWNDLTHQWSMTSIVLQTILEMRGFERVVILDERPQPYNGINALRALAFYPARILASGLVFTLGLTPPAIWSRSMWGIGYKPAESKSG